MIKLIILITGLISFVIKLVLDLPLMIAGVFLIPLALPFSKKNRLPAWAEWCWGNRDHGNDGANFWAKRTLGWPNWLRCYWWLAIRNPTFNWSKYILGVTRSNAPQIVFGNSDVDEDTGNAGWYFTLGENDWEFWEFRFVGYPYRILGRDFCVKLRFGWKITGKQQGERAQFCFVPNPVCAFTPKN